MENTCCCGCSFKTGTLIIAIIEMVIAGISTAVVFIAGGVIIGGLAVHVSNENEYHKTVLGTTLGVVIAIVIVCLLFFAAKFYLGLLLKRGSDQEDLRKCRIWFIFKAIFLSTGVVCLFIGITSGRYSVLGSLFVIFYELFSLWVVWGFMQELKAGKVFNCGEVFSEGTAVGRFETSNA